MFQAPCLFSPQLDEQGLPCFNGGYLLEVIKMTGLNATRYAKCGLAAAAAMAAVSGASAAQINWGAASDFDDATDVVNNGSVVQAVSSSAQTVNGVAFSAVAPIGDFNSGGQYGNGTFLGLTGNSDFDQLAASHQYEGGDLLSTITLSGLTATQQYSFQFFIVDTRYGGTFSARTVVLGDNSGGTARPCLKTIYPTPIRR